MYTAQAVRRFYYEELARISHEVYHSQPPVSSTPVYAPNQTVSPREAEKMEARDGER